MLDTYHYALINNLLISRCLNKNKSFLIFTKLQKKMIMSINLKVAIHDTDTEGLVQ
jgi:hypothetical protein